MRRTGASKRRPPVPLAVQLLSPPAPSHPDQTSSKASKLDSGYAQLPALFPTPTPALTALHERVYGFIALALRAYVQQWYVRISPRDAEVIPTINSAVLVPMLGPLMANLRREAIVDLVLLHAPAIALLHVRTLREAQRAPPWSGGLGERYHARLPLRSVRQAEEGDYVVNADYYYALFSALQAQALPFGDATVERSVVAEVIANSVLGNVSMRITKPWFWAQMGSRLLSRPRQPRARSPPSLNSVHASLTAGRKRLLAVVDMWRAAAPPERKYRQLLVPYVALLREIARPSSIPAKMAFFFLGLLALVLSPIADRLLPLLVMQILDPALGIRLVDLLERIIFPCDGYPNPEEFIEPPPDQQAIMWSQFRQDVRAAAPWARFLVGRKDGEWVDTLLDPLAHKGPNSHLAAMLYDSVLGTAAPGLVAPNDS